MLYIWIDVRELGPRYRAWALEPVFLRPKLHSTSYNRPCTWTLSLGPDSSEHNLGPGTRNNTTVNTLSKPPPPLPNHLRHTVPSCPAMHLTMSLPSRHQKWELVPMPFPPFQRNVHSEIMELDLHSH